MTSSMEQLYQQVILDHARDPHGRGLVDGPVGAVAGESHQVNPTCGDEVTLRVALGTDGAVPVVDRVSWEGQGCSISQASVSVLTDLVTGTDLHGVDAISETFRALMHTRGAGLDDEREDALGDAWLYAMVEQLGRFRVGERDKAGQRIALRDLGRTLPPDCWPRIGPRSRFRRRA